MPADALPLLSDKKLMIIFASSTAGLGHLRVTDALYHSLPTTVSPVILGSHDPSVSTIHRIMSTHFFLRNILEWVQKGTPEKIFSYLYKNFLRSQANTLYKQVITLLEQRLEVPKTVLIVATHMGLAHQFGALKEKLMKEKDIRIILAVQVTDDSPQLLWYIPEADMIFVPSETTKHALMQYGEQNRLPHVPFEVNPYPISPILSQELHQNNLENRVTQVQKDGKSTIHVAVPIPGAAVGINYLSILIHMLHKQSSRFVFHIVSKEAPFTKIFLQKIRPYKCVTLYTSPFDKEVVNQYEHVYSSYIISLEITKPSEQAFKALLTPCQKGGSLLLFSTPIGRQEYDNLDFLRRHFLIPNTYEQTALWEGKLPLPEQANLWRGVMIPNNPHHAAEFIMWCLRENIFAMMMEYKKHHQNNHHVYELGNNGAFDFWKKVSRLL